MQAFFQFKLRMRQRPPEFALCDRLFYVYVYKILTWLIFFQEGGIAERICRIIDTALKSPHVPLQVSTFCYSSKSDGKQLKKLTKQFI